MNEKKLYESPEMEIIRFEEEDIIRTSRENEMPPAEFPIS